MASYSGTEFEFTDNSRAGSPEFRLVLTRCPGDLFLPEHEHSQSFLSFLMSGDYREGLRSSWSDCGENSITWHPEHDAHEVQHGPSAVTSLQIEFAENRIDGIRLNRLLPDRRTSACLPRLRPLLGQMLNEARINDEFSAIAVRGYVLQLLAELGRTSRYIGMDSLAALLETAMEDAFPQQPDIEGVASRAGITPAELACQFRRQTGLSVAAVLRQKRISRACELLGDQDRPLSDIAVECGFFDQSHFTRIFSRYMHCTPGQYRKLNRH